MVGLPEIWQEYKEIVLVLAGALATLFFRDILPALWRTSSKLSLYFCRKLGIRLSAWDFERRYLKRLCELHRFVNVRGIRTRFPVALELEKVYVSLSVHAPSASGAVNQTDSGADVTSSRAETNLVGLTTAHDITRSTERRLSISQALRLGSQRLAILGGPGTGKTTLLKYLALKFARKEAKTEMFIRERRLPIVIALRELPRSRINLTAENLPALCVPEDLVQYCPQRFFSERLQASRCIVLLDGLDEVTTDEERRGVCREVEAFVAAYPGNRYIVTSRPAGYVGAALAGFAEFDICEFNQEDIDGFARHWCLASSVAKRARGVGDSDSVAIVEAQCEAEDLLASIGSSERVQHLCVNPLLLTIVAMVHRYRARLPQRRVELYEECTQVLLEHWDSAKGIATRLDWARKRRVLEALAYWMHTHTVQETDVAQAHQVIAGILPSIGEEASAADEFLADVKDRSGLLMEQRLGTFGFSHLTFQEYLTACCLIDREEQGRQEILAHLHDPWWSEVLLLYAGMRDPSLLISDILAQPDDALGSNLMSAGRCLRDAVQIDPRVEDQVLTQLFSKFQSGEYLETRQQAADSLVELQHSPSAAKMTAILVLQIEHSEMATRALAVKTIGRLLGTRHDTLGTLMRSLKDPASIVRRFSAEALGQAKEPSSDVVDSLLKCLEDDDPTVRSAATQSLVRLGRGRKGLGVASLTRSLENGSELVRQHTIEILSALSSIWPNAIEAILPMLGDTSGVVRQAAARSLETVGEGAPFPINKLLRLVTNEDFNARWIAAQALVRLGRGQARVARALMRMLEDDDSQSRALAASALGELGRTDRQILDALLKRVRNDHPDIQGRAIQALGLLAEPEWHAVGPIFRRLKHQDAGVRFSAALALGRIGVASFGVVEGLIDALEDLDPHVRSMAAYTLGSMGSQAKVSSRAPLLRLITDAHPAARASATYALVRLRCTDKVAGDAILTSLQDRESSVRSSALRALGRFGEVESRVLRSLLGCLADPVRAVRLEASKTMASVAGRDRRHVETLITCLAEDSSIPLDSVAHALGLVSGGFAGQSKIQVTAAIVPFLTQALTDDRATSDPIMEIPIKVKDIARYFLQRAVTMDHP